MRTLCLLALLGCLGCKDRGPPLEDRPLGSKIHFEAIHYANGKDSPRRLVVRGTLDGTGQMELDPNLLTVEDGKITGSTCMGYTPIAVRIKSVDTPDPENKGRKIYDIVPDAGEYKRQYSLVLSPNEAGPHHLLIREGERRLGMFKLVDPGRREHGALGSKLAKATVEEREAISELRKEIGYSFRFRQEVRDEVTFLYIPDAGDVCRLDAALKKLPNLLHLGFHGGRLGPEGLKCLGKMSQLRTMDFTEMEIDDRGLACLKGAPQLEGLSFFGSRGITDAGLPHFRGLKSLKSLDLRNEKYAAMERKPPRITDAGLAHLAGLTELEYLNLTGQDITDSGMKHLEGLKKLSVIHATGGKFSPLQQRPMK